MMRTQQKIPARARQSPFGAQLLDSLFEKAADDIRYLHPADVQTDLAKRENSAGTAAARGAS